MNDYFEKILQAEVYEVAKKTPLEKAHNLSNTLNNEVFLKREDLQDVFSFKIRGAYNKMSKLSNSQLAQGVITSSAGNHAQGVALSALKLNCQATILMPITTPLVKVNAVKNLKAKVILHGDNYDETYQEALRISHERNLCFIHPFDDPDVIAGQGTIAIELEQQLKDKPYAIYIAVGGGGLISGISLYIKKIWPEVKIIGVEPEDADAMTKSLEEEKIVELHSVGQFADGVAVKKIGKNTFDICRKYIDQMIRVNTDEICAAIKDVFEDTRSILEPAGALSIAGMKKDILNSNHSNRKMVAIACGANMNFERLRFVAERAELGECKEVMMAVEIPERAGSLIDFCKLLDNRNLTEFSYRMANSKNAQIFIGVQVYGLNDKNNLLNEFRNSEYAFIDISDDELSKNHLRHMVGGRLPVNFKEMDNRNFVELLYRFEFPERPGALINFLNNMKSNWSISVFHYRNYGADVGKIVIGVLIDRNEILEWNKFVRILGYKFWDETQNDTYKLFLGATEYI
ncbi:threonine ammonia-lyase, biosynthetic [Prochlorococcus marinus XMU1419]|uniref:threonine ammonia-lyase, biosynthetic n=1 Tax=Prochlorococcus marinus TaxID=1219 RepID=UPI001ADC0515|nr:threonine ammonia-lyase, biosynthetic [Prochlorococcus marinus]MBO8233820.1 threonine ammonia-lyase, biosynthetic [Prochlorococcus marinus XMU1419]MBW3077292.1 threonine ammonia-lyase, biosynthetic [Prochlorococcus marinus str. XMU1419]